MVERFNRTIKDQILKFALEGKHWTEVAPIVMNNLNNMRNQSTGLSPSLIVLGRNTGWYEKARRITTVHDWNQHILRIKALLYPAVLDRIQTSHETNERQKGRVPKVRAGTGYFQQYDCVYLTKNRQLGQIRSMETYREGPFVIMGP
eukprot:Nk52_evm1s1543 gene=Nk52_evmTU1s1543